MTSTQMGLITKLFHPCCFIGVFILVVESYRLQLQDCFLDHLFGVYFSLSLSPFAFTIPYSSMTSLLYLLFVCHSFFLVFFSLALVSFGLVLIPYSFTGVSLVSPPCAPLLTSSCHCCFLSSVVPHQHHRLLCPHWLNAGVVFSWFFRSFTYATTFHPLANFVLKLLPCPWLCTSL